MSLAAGLHGRTLPEGPAVTAPASANDPAGIHAVALTDGSALHGTVQTLTETELILQRTDASEALHFPVPSLAHLDFAPKSPDSKPPHATVQFRSGDWMTAEVLLLREGKMELRMADAQRLSIEQGKVESLCFSQGAAPDVFHGPSSMEGWETNGAWSYDQGVLNCQQMGNLLRNFSVMPDRLDLQFTMDKGEVQKNFMLSMVLNRTDLTPGKGVGNAWMQVRFNEGQLYLYAAAGEVNRNSSTSLPRSALRPAADGKFHYRILQDRPGGKLHVFVNGRRVATQAAPPMKTGTWQGQMTFQPMRWGSEVEWAISQIHLTPWDGQVPNAEGVGVPEQLDSLTLQNGETKIGRLESLLGSVLKFRSAAGSETFPRQEISMLRLHREAPEAPVEAKGPKIWLTQRGEFQLTSLQLAGDTCTLGTTFAGQLTLSRDALAAAVFPNAMLKALPVTDWLQFRNGDGLRGSLLSADKHASLRWQTAGGAVLQFQIKRLSGVRIAPRHPDVPAEPGSCVARFHNGDWISGELQSLDAQQLHFQALGGQSLALPRARLQALFLSPHSQRPVCEGATDPASWLSGTRGHMLESSDSARANSEPSQSVLRHLDGAFLITGKSLADSGIGRIVEDLPERLEMSFDCVAANDSLSLNVELFYEKDSSNGVLLRFWPGGLYLQDFSTPNKPGRGPGRQPIQLQWGEKVNRSADRHHFQIFADRRKRALQIFIDGTLITRHHHGENNAPEAMWGRGISVGGLPGQVNGPTLISQLWIAPWSGRTPASPPLAPNESALALANGDESNAPIVNATSDAFTLDFNGEPLAIPRAKVLVANFGSAAGETDEGLTLAAAAKQSRLRLASGGALTVTDFSLENELLQGTNPNLGALQLPVDSVREIIWSNLERDALTARPAHKARVLRR